MKHYSILVVTIALLFVSSVSAVEDKDKLDDVTMKIAHHKMARAEALGATVRETVLEYMLEMGDITHEEIETMKDERTADIAEMRTLREAGDKEGLAIKHKEMREKRAARKAKVKQYVSDNPELATRIQSATFETRKKIKRKMRKKFANKYRRHNEESDTNE